jgi:hypothetical protein
MIYSGYFEYKRENCEWVSSGANEVTIVQQNQQEI